MLMAPLRVSSADTPADRRRAAMDALEACGFEPDRRTAVAVLAACGVEGDADLDEAAAAVRTAHAADAGRDLAREFFSLKKSERLRRSAAVAEAMGDARGIASHYAALSELAGVPAATAGERAAEVNALATLAALDPAAAGKAAASLAVQAEAAGGVRPLPAKAWPKGKAALARNGGPPLWLVPPEAAGVEKPAGRMKSFRLSKQTAAPEGVRNPWGIVLLCLLVVGLLIYSTAALKQATPRRNARQRAADLTPPAFRFDPGKLDLSKPNELPSPGLPLGGLRPAPPDPVNAAEVLGELGYRPGFVESLDRWQAAALGRLEAVAADPDRAVQGDDGLRSLLQKPPGAPLWLTGWRLADGEIAPGVPAADVGPLAAALERLRGGEDEAEMAAWLRSVGTPPYRAAEPPWAAGRRPIDSIFAEPAGG